LRCWLTIALHCIVIAVLIRLIIKWYAQFPKQIQAQGVIISNYPSVLRTPHSVRPLLHLFSRTVLNVVRKRQVAHLPTLLFCVLWLLLYANKASGIILYRSILVNHARSYSRLAWPCLPVSAAALNTTLAARTVCTLAPHRIDDDKTRCQPASQPETE